MKNIHVLPTDKPSRLHLQNGNLVLHRLQYTLVSQHIYITNDEKIKEGDWFITKGEVFKCTLSDEFIWINNFDKFPFIKIDCKKIILTDNTDLIKDGVQVIDDEFLEWFVKNPSCESVEVEYGDDGNGYQIIIPKEEPKQETLEEAAKEYLFEVYQKQFIVKTNDIQHGVLKGFIAGAKWQQQQNKNLYSDEDMEQAFVQGASTDLFNTWNLSNEEIAKEKFKEWFNQNKKK